MRWHMVESVQCFFPALANLRDISRECSLSPLPTYIAPCMEVEVGGQQTGLYIPFVVVESRVENFASQQTNDNVKFDNNTETCNTASYSNKQTTMSNFWQLHTGLPSWVITCSTISLCLCFGSVKIFIQYWPFFLSLATTNPPVKKERCLEMYVVMHFIIFRVAFFFEN